MTALLTVRGLCAGYGSIHVLNGVDLSVAEAGVSTLLGANGAGKTTTLRAISGMLRATGEILLSGTSILSRPSDQVARLGVAHVPEGRGTFASLSTEENLRCGAITRADRSAVQADMERMYELFPRLRERRHQQAGTLSGGEQQMLSIARALMLRPKLMILDEPSFGLAPIIVQELFEILRRINREQRVGLLIVEQNAQLALDLADYAYVLETGRVVTSGPASCLRGDESIKNAYLGH
ncbi:ABC transporter ATP-binding protein [Variovorax sp. LARHSF232]